VRQNYTSKGANLQ